MRSLRITVRVWVSVCSLPHSLQALDRPVPSDQRWEETHHQHLKGICPNSCPEASVYTHKHWHSTSYSRGSTRTSFAILLDCICCYICFQAALPCSTSLCLGNLISLLYLCLCWETLFIQVCDLWRNRENHAEKLQAVFVCVLHPAACAAVKLWI